MGPCLIRGLEESNDSFGFARDLRLLYDLNVNDGKTNEREGADEVYRARGLAAAERIGHKRKCGVESGRHRQTSENEQRYDDEQDDEIGKPLKNVVIPGLITVWKTQT